MWFTHFICTCVTLVMQMCYPCNAHMPPMWCPCVIHVIPMCHTCGAYVMYMWCPHIIHVMFMCHIYVLPTCHVVPEVQASVCGCYNPISVICYTSNTFEKTWIGTIYYKDSIRISKWLTRSIHLYLMFCYWSNWLMVMRY